MEKRPYEATAEGYSGYNDYSGGGGASNSYGNGQQSYSNSSSSYGNSYNGTTNSSSGYGNDSSGYKSKSYNRDDYKSASSYGSDRKDYRGSRDNKYGGGSGGYSRNDSYSRNGGGGGGGYSRNDNYSRNDSYRSRGGGGGYSSRGRGGGRSNGDNWQCSGCRYSSNYASRSTCYKCQKPREDGGGEPRNKWGRSDDSYRKPYGNKDWSSKGDKGGSRWSNSEEGLIDWDQINKAESERFKDMAEIVKDLYEEDPEVTALTPEEVAKFREGSNEMEITNPLESDRPTPNPVQTFKHAFSKYPVILQQIEKQGFTKPSSIQAQSWPILMKGYDMIGTSQTGSGKTLAFLLPGLLHIIAQTTPRWERRGPTVLVLAPTRELAQQIEKETWKFEYEGIRCVCCYGQGDRRVQIQKLNSMCEIVIATPGRLNDLVEAGNVDLSGVSYLVLDEADRMLDMGFEPQVRRIVMNIRPDRQTILTSATWPDEVVALSSKLMKNPLHVIIGSLDLKAVDTITQRVLVCSVMEKEQKLMEFMAQMKPEDKAIIFVAQKITVDDLSVKLAEQGYKVESMHGGRSQRDRENSLRSLKSGRSKILIATDVAARGIDIQDITHVMNYDCPNDMEEYVHRVGRTGRAGRDGEAITFMCRDDWKVSGKLVEILEKSGQEVPDALQRLKDRWERSEDNKAQWKQQWDRSKQYRGWMSSEK